MVAHPEKELRFTRMAQARLFAILASLFLAASVTFFATWSTKWFYHTEPPVDPVSATLLLLPALPLFWAARYCAKHAFLILSPVGIEIFPLYKPTAHFRVVNWSDIHSAEITANQLFLHQNETRTTGVVVSLAPLTTEGKYLLQRAIEGRMKERET